MNNIQSLQTLNRSDLNLVGGKGANLGALIQAGLPVPPGFCVTTQAYKLFVESNGIGEKIQSVLQYAELDALPALETISETIRSFFYTGLLPETLADEIVQAYRALAEPPEAVAVRSSATAEDLPDLSFAGQQDTYLNIVGEQALLEAVVRCWASLWTARAIGYRARNQISQTDISLAVVVQKMVHSQSSGVLFTANPLTGKRSETVIEATFGLGEALVSGLVEPDHYVIETVSGQILNKKLGAKALNIQSQDGGGTFQVRQAASDQQALDDELILALTYLGQRAAAYFEAPQDMEWAVAGGKLYIVQSRPITSLYPLPKEVKAAPLEVYFSFGVWQGMLDPYTLAGQEVFNHILAGFARVFNAEIEPGQRGPFLMAGERIYVDITGLLKNPTGRGVVNVFIPSIDPVSGRILNQNIDNWAPEQKEVSLKGKLQFFSGAFRIPANIIFNLLRPVRGRERLQNKIEEEVTRVQAIFSTPHSLADLIETIEEVWLHLPVRILPVLLGGIMSGQIPLQVLLRTFALEIPEGEVLTLELTRGLSHNVTTEMDLALWRTAEKIRLDVASDAYFAQSEVSEIAMVYQAGQLPPVAQAAVGQFMAQYGMRGVGEIDLGRPRWREDPRPVFQAIKSYLQIDPEASPEAVFRRGAEHALQAQKKLLAEVRQLKGGRFKAWVVKQMIGRYNELGGLRESPKFFIIRAFDPIHNALLAAGKRLAAQGILTQAEDIFFFYFDELKTLEMNKSSDWKKLAAERRAVYERELRRKRLPRFLLSDGTAYYDAPSVGQVDQPGVITGSPVSAGVVEGLVRVVVNPHGAQLTPGEIMVCPATDPAWTPLFLAAGGLIMEVGGMMTHGSVVAREYGIPAVVGVPEATTRLQTGQRVRVDGATGQIQILDGPVSGN
jgi:pyruvate,water dikinase